MSNHEHFKVSDKFIQGREQWKVVNDLWGGTAKMREAREVYLPSFPNEDSANYEIRLKGTTLLNVYKRTIKVNVSKIFSKPVQVQEEDNTEELVDFQRDVTGTGQTLTQFTKQLGEKSVNHGVSYLLVDFPTLQDNATFADERQNTPFWIKIEATQVLEVRSKKVGGVHRLTYFRYLEDVPDTLQSDTIRESNEKQQVKLFQQDVETGVITFEVWRKDGDTEFLAEFGTIQGQEEIPIVPIYSNMVEFFMGQPVLYDLAEKNIQHWQNESDQSNIMRIARVPMLQVKGYNKEFDGGGKNTNELTISPNTILSFPDSPDSGAAWIEHGGEAIESGRQQLKDIEGHMAALGLELFVERPNGETATGRMIDQAEANSLLKDIAISFKMSIEKALEFTLIYMNKSVDDLGTVEMNTQISSPFRGSEDLKELLELFKMGAIDVETLLKEAVRRDLLVHDTDIVQVVADTPEPVAPTVINNLTNNGEND